MASETTLAFLEEHNRPFSLNEIQSGIKQKEEAGKAALQKALNMLVKKGKVVEKLYGKQKIYHVFQKTDMSKTEMNEKLLELDKATNEIVSKLEEVKDKIKVKSQLFSDLKKLLTIEEANEKKNQLTSEIEQIKSELEEFEGLEAVSPERKAKIEQEYDIYLKEYKKRKRMCMDMLDTILENYPKSKKQLFEDIGVETDEDCGFSLNELTNR